MSTSGHTMRALQLLLLLAAGMVAGVAEGVAGEEETEEPEEVATDVAIISSTLRPANFCLEDHPELAMEGLYEVPGSIVALLSFCYGSISVLAVAGNALVMWIVATSRRMQSVTNCFIANLALADIVIGLFAIPFQFQAALLQRWNLPHFMCGFCPFVQVLSVNVSVFTLTAIAVDRHRAILSPLSARPSKVRARVCLCAIWAAAAALAAPMPAVLRVVPAYEYRHGACLEKAFCALVGLRPSHMALYRLLLFLIQYAFPLAVISSVYARMALRLWGSRAPGNAQGPRDAALMRNKKRVIKMLVIVVAMFAICWLPLQTYNVLQDAYPEINTYRYINIIFFCSDWLAMSNSCCNPFIYGIYNEKFKREFRQRCRVCRGGGGSGWRGRRGVRGGRASPSPPTESVDLERASLRSLEWRRSASQRPHRAPAHSANGQASREPSPGASPRRLVPLSSSSPTPSPSPAPSPARAPARAHPRRPCTRTHKGKAKAAAGAVPEVGTAVGAGTEPEAVYAFPDARLRRQDVSSSLEELCL